MFIITYSIFSLSIVQRGVWHMEGGVFFKFKFTEQASERVCVVGPFGYMIDVDIGIGIGIGILGLTLMLMLGMI